MTQSGTYDEYMSIAELYDHVVPYRERQDVGFFVEAAKESGGPVLEVGCGTGQGADPDRPGGSRDHRPGPLAAYAAGMPGKTGSRTGGSARAGPAGGRGYAPVRAWADASGW